MFSYTPPQDQDYYFYINDGDDVWFIYFFFVLKPFTFLIFWYFIHIEFL